MIFVLVKFVSWYGKQREMFSITTKVCLVRVHSAERVIISANNWYGYIVVGLVFAVLYRYDVLKLQNFITWKNILIQFGHVFNNI